MPSRAVVIDQEQTSDGFIVVVKVRGPGTKDFSNPVAKRAKLAAARHVGIVEEYVPSSLSEVSRGENINEMLEGTWAGEIETMQTLKEGVQQTVLYGIRIEK